MIVLQSEKERTFDFKKSNKKNTKAQEIGQFVGVNAFDLYHSVNII